MPDELKPVSLKEQYAKGTGLFHKRFVHILRTLVLIGVSILGAQTEVAFEIYDVLLHLGK